MKSSLQWVLVLVACFACKPRSSEELGIGEEGISEDSSRVDTLEVMIESLKNQLETNQKISDAEREELERQLKQAEAERAKAATPTPTPTATPSSTPTPSVPKLEGPYNIYYSTDCMQPIDPNNLADGSIFKAVPCNNSQVQQFSLEIRESGYFRIIHKSTSKCLVMTGDTAGEGTPPTLQTCKTPSDNAEQWRFFDAATDGANFKLQNRLTNFCLKIGNDGTIFQGNCATNYTIFMLKKTP